MPTATMTWQDVLDEREDQPQQEEDGCQTDDRYSPEAEAQLRSFAQDFYGDVRVLTRQYMEQFFSNKMLHCGGKIPRSLLYTDTHISMVMNFDISKGVDRAYEALEPLLSPEEVALSKQTGEATSDIKLVNDTLNLLARSGIPKQFAGGMMLLYLKFVEGIEVDTSA
jgi:hypothetical protein